MQKITIADEEVIVIPNSPNWAKGMVVDFTHKTDVQTTLSGQESRTRKYDTFRLGIDFEIMLEDSEIQAFNDILNQRSYSKVAIPLWFDNCNSDAFFDSRILKSKYAFNHDGSIFRLVELKPGHKYELDKLVPFVVGYLGDTVSIDYETNRVAFSRVQVIEDSPPEYALTVNDVTYENFPDIEPNWTKVDENSVYEIEGEYIGEGREKSLSNLEKLVVRGTEADFKPLNRSEARTMIEFFHYVGGSEGSFTLTGWGEGKSRNMRLAKDELSLKFITDRVITTRLKLVEAPWGTTITERILPKAHLFEFRYNSPTPVVWRFTDYEKSITHINEYLAKPFSIGDIQEDIENGLSEIELTSWVFDGNPLLKFLPNTVNATMELTVKRVFVNDPANGETLFVGDIQEVTVQGREIQASAVCLGGVFDRAFPSILLQKTDNHMGFSEGNGLNLSDYKETATIVSISGSVVKLSGINSTTNYYLNGYLETGDGENYEQKGITQHSGNSLTLISPLRFADVGQSVSIYPGYDGEFETAIDKFDNEAFFLGFPHIPNSNPTLVSKDTNTGGAKGK